MDLCLLLTKLGGYSPDQPRLATKSPLGQAGAGGVQTRTRLISLCVSPTPEGINRGNPSFIQARVWIFPWQQTQVEGMDTHSHLCSSSFSRESPHLSASSGVGLWKKDGTLAKLSSKSCFCCLLNISSGLKARL